MNNLYRLAALVLLLSQLFLISAAADGEVSASAYEKMIAAATGGTAVTSGAAVTPKQSSGADTASASETAASAGDAEKEEGEYIPVTTFGNEGDVMIGGLEIHAGRWYTVVDGELMEAPPWPDSYLYYSASQSKITLHEFHYKIPADKHGKGDTFAALYLPKDMKIVLEGENELVNRGYTVIDGTSVSNGVYARDHKITFEGDGVLSINTRSDEGMVGYGVFAEGGIRIAGDFIGLSVFGPTAAFRSAPYTTESREMILRRANLHPEYNGGVTVRDGSPYDKGVFTRNRYILFVVGDQISPEQELRAMIEAEYARARGDYDEAVENAILDFGHEVGLEMDQVFTDLDAWQAEASDELIGMQSEWQSNGAYAPYNGEEAPIGSMLDQLMRGIG